MRARQFIHQIPDETEMLMRNATARMYSIWVFDDCLHSCIRACCWKLSTHVNNIQGTRIQSIKMQVQHFIQVSKSSNIKARHGRQNHSFFFHWSIL